jgi:hypothetical protein
MPVDVHAVPVERRHPPRHLLPDRVAGVEVVVARRGEQHGLLGQSAKRGRDGDGLNVEAHRGANVERVARDHQRVEVACGGEQPVELAQPVVQVGHQQYVHRSLPTDRAIQHGPAPSGRAAPTATAPDVGSAPCWGMLMP